MTATKDTAADRPAPEQEHVPGEPDMWFFVLFESLVFASYFCVYLWFRTQNEQAFLEAQSALTLPLGILDTILLLTSSWAIARCVQHARAGRYQLAQRFVFVTAGLGIAFLALKLVEW
jgi:nitric oxide reductase NorE protein